MQYNKEKKELFLKRKLNNLDRFVIDFIKVLEKHANYVIISGYISILLGRARATEDIDVFIEKIDFENFSKLYYDLKKNNFWCLNAESEEEIYSYLKNELAVRFARTGKNIPNFEIKFPKTKIDEETLQDFITVNLDKVKLKISSLERQIAFKRHYLKSDKDIEDALHIEEVFENQLDYEKIKKLKNAIKTENEPK